MENQQPEALDVANQLEKGFITLGKTARELRYSAAATIRRLHARIQELEGMLDSVGAGGVSAQRVTQAADHIAQDRKMVAAQEPFGYFKAEPFGWRDCAETDEGAVALYEAPQPQAVDQAPVAWRYQTPTGWHATTDAAAANRVSAHHPIEPLYASPQPQADALDTERLDWLIEQGCSNGVVYENVFGDFWMVWLDGDDANKDEHQADRYPTAREAIDAAIAAAKEQK